MQFTIKIPDMTLILNFLSSIPVQIYIGYALFCFASIFPLSLYSMELRKGYRGWQLVLLSLFWPFLLVGVGLYATYRFLSHKFDGTESY